MFNREFQTSYQKDKLPTYDLDREGNQIVYKERTKDLNEGLRYTDFSLKSLMDADALDLLQPTSLISRDYLTAADIANTAVANIGSVLDNVSVEPKKDEN